MNLVVSLLNIEVDDVCTSSINTPPPPTKNDLVHARGIIHLCCQMLSFPCEILDIDEKIDFVSMAFMVINEFE